MTVVDFGSLPPEVNSARMYAGAGSAPLRGAAAAWHGLSAQLNSAAVSYGETLSELTDAAWHGSSATSMAAAVQPYVSWMNATAAEAAQVASQAQQAVAAYEAAFAATVSPSTVAANRTILAALVATNVLGQNAPAIAANQAEYSEMWVQDAAAMHGYAASAAAIQLPALSAAPQHSNSSQSAQSGTWDSFLNYLENVGSNSKLVNYLNNPNNWFSQWQGIWADYSGLNYFGGSGFGEVLGALGFDVTPEIDEVWVILMALAAQYPPWSSAGLGAAGLASQTSPAGLAGTLASSPVSPAPAAVSELARAEVSANLGRGASVGALSVPTSWSAAGSELRLAASGSPMTPLAGSSGRTAVPSVGGMGGFGSVPMLGSVVNAPQNGQSNSRQGSPNKVVPEFETLSPNGLSASRRPGEDVTTPLSDHERDELEQLRRQNAELVIDRDAAARLIREAIRR